MTMPLKMTGIDRFKIGGWVLLSGMFLLWELLSRLTLVDPNYLPPVTTIAGSLWTLIGSGEIIGHLLISTRRVLAGYLIGALIGYSLGFLCGYIRRIYTLLELTIEYLRPMPSVALIPIGILFLGMGDALNVVIIAWACSWPVFVNTMDGVRATDHILINTARSFGFGKMAIVRQVIVPASLPVVFTGLRVSLGIAVAVVVITEMVASGSGLGFFIMTTAISFRVPEMYAGIIVIGFFGYALNRAFLTIDRKVLKWQKGWVTAGK